MTGFQRVENDKLVEYVKRVREDNDQEAFQAIAKVLHTYLVHLSKRFFRIPGNGSEDVYQDGLIALATKAIPDYREEKGAFVSFAKLCIKRHIITVLKAANNGRNRILNSAVSLDSPAGGDDSEGPMSICEFYESKDKPENPLDMLARTEINSKMKEALLAKLTRMEAEVLECYLKNMSYADIVAAINSKRRGKNKINLKACDNSLCRAKVKCSALMREIGFDFAE